MIIDTHATKFLARGVWITGIRGEKVAMKISQLDRIDQKILMELQTNNRHYNQELADRVAVSAPTCLRRVRRLREAGFIQSDMYFPAFLPRLGAFVHEQPSDRDKQAKQCQ